MTNDSGWYYMNAHFIKTGEYIQRNATPSFDKPSHFYPLMGYSGFVFLCDAIANTTSIEFTEVIKYVQLLLYIFAAFVCVRIFKELFENENFEYLGGLLFVLYYPYFNYTTILMSETYATFILLFVVLQFIRTIKRPSAKSALLLFTFGGYFILIKPVFIPVLALISIVFTIMMVNKRRYRLLFCMFSAYFFLTIQVAINRNVYHSSEMQSGKGFHFWDRVITYDKLIPKKSAALDTLKNIYAAHNQPVSYDYWWFIVKDLSHWGYKEAEIDRLCLAISKDGIKENKVPYFFNTFKNTYTNFNQDNHSLYVRASQRAYKEEIITFSGDPQHRILTNRLLKQEYLAEMPFNQPILKLNTVYAYFSNYLLKAIHTTLFYVLFIFSGIYFLVKLFKQKFKTHVIEASIWCIAFGIMFGVNLAEYPTPRNIQPVIILILFCIVLASHQLYKDIKTRRISA
jgi:hypothetical protein